ncbi:MAG: NADH-quinone oxidoreductase subunit L [Planctomycetota bacterium]|nr:MAG: NADH-quinone oxidoreductase subunit L [Planctomycetota bacterium]
MTCTANMNESLKTTIATLLATAWLLPLFGFVVQFLFALKWWGRKSKAAAYLAIVCIAAGFVCSCTAFYLWDSNVGHLVFHEAKSATEVSVGGDHHSGGADAGFTVPFYSLARFGELDISLNFYIDSLTLTMFMMVTLIATCIHIFATGYMAEELVDDYVDHQVHTHDGGHFHRPGRFYRFFSYLSLFCFAMLGLVIAGNIFQVFIFWELVGICSYLLIGFYVERHSASTAANKAFIVNRVGDFGFIIGLMILWTSFGTFNFSETHLSDHSAKPGLFQLARGNDGHLEKTADGKEVVLKTQQDEHGDWQAPPETSPRKTIAYTLLIVAGLGVFGGCVGKSAQFPLQTWLPDAMEGPTPVSALVHSATMVAAGVYLAGRFYPMFTPEVLLTIAYVGCITAFVAATIAIVATDIKKVLAYSTISQLGYMMLGLGVGGWGAGLFHLITHAFFKSLMFLCSGSVIAGCHHEQEMPKMGGLLKKMPITALTMLVGVMAIAGLAVPGLYVKFWWFIPYLSVYSEGGYAVAFSGFHSKDAILATALAYTKLNQIHFLLFLIPLLTAGITAFYMFRLWFFTFLGKPRDKHLHDHVHESPWVMTAPLLVLACFAAFCAFGGEHGNLFRMLTHSEPVGVGHGSDGTAAHTVSLPGHAAVLDVHSTAGSAALLAAFCGMAIAYLIYGKGVVNPDDIKRQAASVHAFLANKWGFDDLYDTMFVKPAHVVAKFCAAIDKFIFDEILHTLVRMGIAVSKWDRKFDEGIIDGIVNLVGNSTYSLGLGLRGAQTGRIRQYVTFIAVSVVTLFVLLFAFYPKG